MADSTHAPERRRPEGDDSRNQGFLVTWGPAHHHAVRIHETGGSRLRPGDTVGRKDVHRVLRCPTDQVRMHNAVFRLGCPPVGKRHHSQLHLPTEQLPEVLGEAHFITYSQANTYSIYHMYAVGRRTRHVVGLIPSIEGRACDTAFARRHLA